MGKAGIMRLFIAAQLPEKVREALAEESGMLRGCVRGRYVSPDSFHVTLAFLGDVDSSRIDTVTSALEKGCAGFGSFEVSLGEYGSFGRRGKATLWQGFREEGDLSALADSIRAQLDEAGIAFDGKAFRAHVTLMRAADLKEGVLPMPERAQGTIEQITLFRSDLSGSRPVYDPLHTVCL